MTLILVEQSPNINDMGDHKLIRANVAGVFWDQRREFNIAQKEDKLGPFEGWDGRF